jgi:hypothetical protein
MFVPAIATQTLTVTDCTGLEELGLGKSVQLYPNPNNGIFTISIADAEFRTLQISVYDALGREIFANNFKDVYGNFTTPILLEGIQGGVYFVRLSSEAKTSTFRLVIE